MTTLRQIEANRKNAEKSTGPRTAAGKEQSRGNAVTHGLTSNVAMSVDMEAAINQRVAILAREYPAANEMQAWRLRQTAIESVRVDFAQQQEIALTNTLALRAEACWEEDRRAEAGKLLARLPRKPETVVRELEMTMQGCDLMIERWEALIRELEKGEPWNDACREMAFDLLGIVQEFRETHFSTMNTISLQSAVAEQEIEILRSRQTRFLDTLNESARSLAIRGHMFPGREIWKLRFYELAAKRRFLKGLQELSAARGDGTEPAPAIPRTEFEVVNEPIPVNPFDRKEMFSDHMMDRLVEREMIHSEVDQIDDEPEARAVSLSERETEPTPVKGNRRERKARLRRQRQMVG